MPLFRQLEFGFDNHTVDPSLIGQPLGLPTSKTAIPKAFGIALQSQVRALLRSNGAGRIANQVRVEWNPRLKTCAGRADYRHKLITLNPELTQHPGEVDRTLRHELAHLLAQFRAGRHRISPHGTEWQQACRDLAIADERRCHNLPFAAQVGPARFVYRCTNCGEEFRRVRRIRRAVACLACCRTYNHGRFDPRFRLCLVRSL
jgi:predicted SprT family Zn-dependent metalloprotease